MFFSTTKGQREKKIIKREINPSAPTCQTIIRNKPMPLATEWADLSQLFGGASCFKE
jgi:hypothetical protein